MFTGILPLNPYQIFWIGLVRQIYLWQQTECNQDFVPAVFNSNLKCETTGQIGFGLN